MNCKKNKIVSAVLIIFIVLLAFFDDNTVLARVDDDTSYYEQNNSKVLKSNESVMVSYAAHIQKIGWTEFKNNGEQVGTEGQGLRLEALKIKVANIRNYTGDVIYRSHVQTYGWEKNWKKNGEVSGTEGEAKRLEAVQINLTGELGEKYDVYYRVHVETFGWLNWAKDGEMAGSSGYSKEIEAIEIVLVDKNGNPPGDIGYSYLDSETGVSYLTHIQTYGWQGEKTNGAQSGTVGLSKRMESIQINLKACPYEGDIEYQSHIQTYGWEKEWKKNGQKSGLEGKSKRLEAIRIRLTGELAEKCDIYYRVHSQHFGWLGWVKNGEEAGTSGFSYRIESIQILLLPKNARTFAETTGFVEKGNNVDIPNWSVSEINMSSEDGYLVNTKVDLLTNPVGTVDSLVECHYAWENNTTGESGIIGNVKLGESISWYPQNSGTYLITMTAKDESEREISKQMNVEILHGSINKSDAFFSAHRGLSSQAPDNSIPAFELAGMKGFDSIEADVIETKDGVYVISHDNNLSDLCGINENISDLTYEELKNYEKYHIRNGNNVNKYSDYELRIPTLEEFLDICCLYQCIPQLDTKELSSFESISNLYQILCERGIQDDVIVTSFNNLYLQSLRDINPNITLTYGVSSTQSLDFDWLCNYNIGVSVNYTRLLANDDNFLDKGINVNAYTVNDKKNAGVLIENNITSITTNCVLWDETN